MGKSIKRVELMPKVPEPFQMRDWKAVAHGYDNFVFDFDRKGQYLPLIKWNKQNHNFRLVSFCLPTYVGQDNGAEAINQIAALVGSSLVGIDKSNQDGLNWVQMVSQYYNQQTSLIGNKMENRNTSGGSFWYQIFPSILFYQLVSLYPKAAIISLPGSLNNRSLSMEEMMYASAEQFYQAALVMGSGSQPLGFKWSGFDFQNKKPVFNGRWREPDACAGIAWLEYMAYLKFGNPKFLEAAELALGFLETADYNPLYEVLLIYGTYLGARLNAELGRNYDLDKLINWCFDPSDACEGWGRPGWGVIADNWGGYDAFGLQGSVTDSGGYAFAMNTYQWAGILAPIVRYDQSYANSIGKWILNLANNSRLFYGVYHEDSHQSSSFWNYDLHGYLAYEGIRKRGPIIVPSSEQVSPYATGDAIRCNWAPTDFGLYGSSHVGYLAGLINSTNDPKILQIDLLVTDFYHAAAYPTYLYYNPYDMPKCIEIDLGSKAMDLYDTVKHAFIVKNASGKTKFTIDADAACVIVLVPANKGIRISDHKLFVEDVVIDYQWQSK